ncbi:MAG: DUF1697 domain-containing protein [Thermoanaerobaculia bacterium]
MTRWVAFLRGMNLGGRRVTNEQLCSAFAELGLRSPTAFLASGNVVFESEEADATRLSERLAGGLEEHFGYAVPTFLRRDDEVRAIVAHRPFPTEVIESSKGKLQVALLPAVPSAAVRKQVLAHTSDEDRLDLAGRELYWLPSGGILDAELDLVALEKLVGPWTMRTRRTMERLAAKLLGQ